MRYEAKAAYLQGIFAMRMRGLEPPPGCPDTDLNRASTEQMGPSASGPTHFAGFVALPDIFGRVTVAKLLPRARQVTGGTAWFASRRSQVRSRLAPPS